PNKPADQPSKARRQYSQTVARRARVDAAAAVTEHDTERSLICLPGWKPIISMRGDAVATLTTPSPIPSIPATAVAAYPPTTNGRDVSECTTATPDAAGLDAECAPDDQPSPAWEAGLRPGDVITEFNHQPVADWDELSSIIQRRANTETAITYLRDGEVHETQITPVRTERPVLDRFDQPITDSTGTVVTKPVGFIGMSSQVENQRKPVTAAFGVLGDQISGTFSIITVLPAKLWDTAKVLVTDAERDPTGPVSVVGVGRIAGEAAAQQDIP